MVVCIIDPFILSLPESSPYSMCGSFVILAKLKLYFPKWSSLSRSQLKFATGKNFASLEKRSKATAIFYILKWVQGLALLLLLQVSLSDWLPWLAWSHSQATAPPAPVGNPPSPSAAPEPGVCAACYTHQPRQHLLPVTHIAIFGESWRLTWDPAGHCSHSCYVQLSFPTTSPDNLRLNIT